MKSFFPYKDRINHSLQSRLIYRANCRDCTGLYIGKTKRRLHDRKTEHFKGPAKNDNTSAIADHVKNTGHNTKWEHWYLGEGQFIWFTQMVGLQNKITQEKR